MAKTNVSKAPMRQMLSILATPDVSAIRTAELYGQEHTVIPCIALCEGVLWPANAPAPELALAEEFGRFPDGWNGRPVVFDHPRVDGLAVSASSPNVLEVNSFGQLFNTTLDGTKLKTEIWINNKRAESMSEEAQEVIEGLISGDGVVEVSTGLFTMNEMVDGEYEGQEYSAIWRNIVPDHLAVLPSGVRGACSVEDGCGAPRTNSMQPVMRAMQLRTEAQECGCDTKEDAQKGVFQRLLDLAGGILSFKGNAGGLSDNDLRTALSMALNNEMPDSYFFILAVYTEADGGKFVYEQGFDGTLTQREFTMDGDTIAISEERTAVRPVTQFVPVDVTVNETTTNIQENAMNVEELVNGLITNAETQFTEDDREWLSSLDEERLTKLTPVANSESESDEEEESNENESTEAEPRGNEPSTNASVTTDEYIAGAPDEIREILNSGLRMHRARKDALIEGLTANARCKFTIDQLQMKDIEELEYLSELADGGLSYEGQGATLTANEGEEESGFTPAPTIFSKNADAA